ncbi:MAG: T9SS type A sorting domain-containing protein, partial [Bacteroidota bacterium]
NDSLLAGSGGSGTVSQNADGSLSITVSFTDPPSTNLIIRATFDVRYPANSVLNLASLTEELPIDHVLSTNMEPGDEIKVQDPVQSLVGLSISGGFALSRGALRLNETPEWMTFTNIGNVRAMEFTDDGNHLFVSSGGSVYRISGLSRLYSEDQISQVTTTTRIFTGNAFVTGIAIDPNDQNRILITRGNYGVADHVHLVTDALTRTSDANQILTSVQGDLPAMPVYDAEFNVNNSSEVLIGTEFGVWATDDITNANVEWSDENNEVGYTPTYDIRQQKLPYTRAQNHGVFYIGTHGRGIWKTTSLVGIDDDVDDRVSGNVDFVSDVTVYPNPMAGEGNIVFNLTERTTAEVNIMDLQGRIVRTFGKRSYEAGDNQLGINTSDLPMGTYFVTVATATDRKVNKFVVVK